MGHGQTHIQSEELIAIPRRRGSQERQVKSGPKNDDQAHSDCQHSKPRFAHGAKKINRGRAHEILIPIPPRKEIDSPSKESPQNKLDAPEQQVPNV